MIEIKHRYTGAVIRMFADISQEAVKRVIQVGVAFASPSIANCWEVWKAQMELHFGDKVVQLPMMVSLRALKPRETDAAE